MQDKKALLTVARTLNSWGEFDRAETLLWRGIRLYEADKDVWDTALSCTLLHVLYSVAYVEWQRARYRFGYLLRAVPASLRDELSPYFMLGSEQGHVLLDDQQFVMWLWQKGKMREARHVLSRMCDSLCARSDVPEAIIVWMGWSMLGLGLFDMMAQSVAMQKRYPAWVQVAKWFCGEPLPAYPARPWGNALLWLARWAQDLLENRRRFGTVWRSLLACNRPDENLVFYTLFAATSGWRQDAMRQRVERWLDRSSEALFLPYLHLLCVAAAHMRWEPLTQKLWESINLFDVDYPRREELYRYVQTQIPVIQQ